MLQRGETILENLLVRFQETGFGRWSCEHPRILAWLVLAIGMVLLLAYEGRDVGLLMGQWLALVVATFLVAGLCIWIITWEDDDEEETAEQEV